MKDVLLSFGLSSLLFTSSVAVDYELTTSNTAVDKLSIEHTTYQQTYQGVPVFGGQLKLHHNPTTHQDLTTGKISSAGGVVDVNPTISLEEAVEIAQEVSEQSAADVLKNNLYIFNEQLLNKLKPSGNVLVWQIELYQEEPLFHEYYFINAHTGNVVYQIHGLQDAVDRRIWDCSYGAYTGDCYLDTTDPLTSYVYGRSEGQAARGVNPNWYITSLTDTDNLYDALGSTFSYYEEKFLRNGANDAGGMGDGSSSVYPVTGTVGLTYIDYYLLSESDYTSCPNAFFDGARAMHYCESYVTNDITGHEYAHAVNYYSILDGNGDPAGLAYTNEIGALNEANSDVFGEALEYYMTGTNDWLMGAELPDGALRSMSDPTAYTYPDDDGNDVPYPDRYTSENLYCGTGDSGGVHLNSSVVNKAAYLMAVGGTFNGCTITGIGRDMEEAIFYRAQTVYYTTTTDFNGAYTALLAACRDLYSADDCKQVEKALRATELNQAGFCSGEPATDPGCTDVDALPTIINATSDKANGHYKAGQTIDIDITFSEAVSGDVTVTLETGDNDRHCTFTVDEETSGSCNYTIRSGDTSADLNVKSIAGTITDSSGDVVTATIPTTKLKANKQLVVDTTKPSIPETLRIYTSPTKNKRIKTIHPRVFNGVVKNQVLKPYFVWKAVPGVEKYYIKFSNKPITRKQLLKSSNLHTTRHLRGNVEQVGKKYYLYMLLQDRAGNKSNIKTLVEYKSE